MGLSQGVDAQTNIFVVNANGTRVFDKLDIAVQEAVAGDVIYLPAGDVVAGGEIVIDKKLSIIGAGWENDPDKGLRATVIKQNGYTTTIYFAKGSDGSLLYGCNLRSVQLNRYNDQSDDQNIQNVTIARNYTNGITLGINTITNRNKNISILENVIYSGYIYGYNAENCIISNNLISNGVYNLRHSIIANNILGSISTSAFCEIKNNYFIYLYWYSGQETEYCNYYNNAFANNAVISGKNREANNLRNQSVNSTFQTTDNYIGQPKYCFLKNDSPCKNGGTDGTEIGIYGGSVPYKTGNAPFNLYVSRMNIRYTNSTDGLEIDMQVSVQER